MNTLLHTLLLALWPIAVIAHPTLLHDLRGQQAPWSSVAGEVLPPSNAAAGAGPATTAEAELRALLGAQVEAWNRGDIEGFMQGYWKSNRTTFSGSNGILRGWQALLERYRRSYPDHAAMGRLQFSELEITLLAPDAALILGHWQLEREKDRPGGVFTLVARRLPEGWRIIHDHTSAVPPAPAKP